MKVLQINATFGKGSTGFIVRDLVNCCVLNGIEGYYACSVEQKGDCIQRDGYRIGNYISEKWHALMTRLFGRQAYFNRITTWLLLHHIEYIKPDVVHLHNLHSNYIHLNMLLSYLAKKDIATVITMHDCWYFTGGCFHYASIRCDKWQRGCGNCPKVKTSIFPLIDATSKNLKDRNKYLTAIPRLYIVGCSQWVANEARKSVLRNCNIRHIYNGFDLDVFKPTQSNLHEQLGIEEKFILLGPISKWLMDVNKGTLDYFVTAMPVDCVLVLFGASNTGWMIQGKVLLYGYTSKREEMARLYSMADVFVNCSREDTLSSLNLESQACGTPVVTYEDTGNRETVNGECSFSVETGNAKDLWDNVMAVKKAGKNKFAKHCRMWIEDHFSKAENYQKYIDLYRNISQKLND